MTNRRSWACMALSFALFFWVSIAFAQEPPPEEMMAAGPGGPSGPFVDRVEVMGFAGLHGNKVVKGAPFSATAETDTSQTLNDGTSIHRSTTSNLYRDGQGRFRSEVTLSNFGPLQASGKPRTMIAIIDPVAGSRYMLDVDHKVAHQMTMGTHGAPTAAQTQSFQDKMKARLQQEETSGAVKKESLGTQTINGISAEGTRITRTIAAGQIGNDRPIQIVFEHWYSPDLQVLVKSTRTDPRFGTTTYTLTKVQRSEPAATLFTVPADYTVQQGGPMRGGRGRMHMPPPDAAGPQ